MAVYTYYFPPTARTTAVDLFEVLTPAANIAEIIAAEIGQTSGSSGQSETLPWRFRQGATSGGTGGVAPSVKPHGSAPTSPLTVAALNTTKAAGGTIVDGPGSSFHISAGLVYKPLPREIFVIPPSTRLILELVSAPAASITLTGYITIDVS